MHDVVPYRARLYALAYRMLGTCTDAEDVLQEAWLRYSRQDDVRVPEAWLTTCVTRLCIDKLRSARARREVYIGPWLPEPSRHDDPLDVRSLSIAMLHVLERLSPKERATYLLCEVFDYTHAEVAKILETSEEASRKTLSRARARIGGEVRFAPDRATHARVLASFVTAVQSGDLAAIETLLADDAKAVTDAGGHVTAARRTIESRSNVARFFLGLLKKNSDLPMSFEAVELNGWPALALTVGGRRQVVCIETDGNVVHSVFAIMNPEKLGALDSPATQQA